jgi:hypothetical protein
MVMIDLDLTGENTLEEGLNITIPVRPVCVDEAIVTVLSSLLLRLKLPSLQFERYQGAQLPVVEKQVDEEINAFQPVCCRQASPRPGTLSHLLFLTGFVTSAHRTYP